VHVILAVYTALRSFNRPATRREIEREAGLDRDAVAAGLRGLNRPGRRLLVRHAVEPGARGLYSLVPGAPAPTDLRGRWLHDEVWRERQRQGVQAYQAARASGSHPAPQRLALEERTHTTAMVPTHFSAPGSLRTEATARCLLAELWPHRR
jgi:hypothetical protein